MIVFGDKEAEAGTLALRIRGLKDVVVKGREAALNEIQQAATL